MIKNILILLVICCTVVSQLSSQSDDNFSPATYPDGMSALVIDVEAAAELTESEKRTLVNEGLEILLIINMIGDVIEAKVFSDTHDSLFVSRIREACFKLKDFEAAYYMGSQVDSYFNFRMVYEEFGFQPLALPVGNSDDVKISDKGMEIAIGIFGGVYSGSIANHFQQFGGVDLALGFATGHFIYELHVAASIAKKNNDFIVPTNIVKPGNNALALFGGSIGKKISFNKLEFVPKIKIHYSVVNVGFDEEDKLFRHEGISPGLELDFNIPIKKGSIIPYYYNYKYLIPRINVFVGAQYLIMNDSQSKGLWWGAGIRYNLSFKNIIEN